MRKLSEYEPYLSQIMRLIAKDTRFRCRPGLGEILAQNSKLIIAISHGSPLSWLPAVSLLAAHSNARGGAARVPIGVMDHFFFHIPVIRDFAKMLTQLERPLNYFELSERFEKKGDVDLVLFPEGSNCFFGEPSVLQEFRSPKFIELSIRTGAPILVCVHRGSEAWAKAFPVPEKYLEMLNILPKFAFDFFEKRLKATGLLTVPLLPKPMEKFEMLCELYRPSLALSELSEDLSERRAQLQIESEKIRSLMLSLLAEVDESAIAEEPLSQETSVPSSAKDDFNLDPADTGMTA